MFWWKWNYFNIIRGNWGIFLRNDLLSHSQHHHIFSLSGLWSWTHFEMNGLSDSTGK
jgi:hypothetical protein